ncbi:MAG: hypothetical protein ACTSQY_10365, partial [Candidatus Odinarchaeia archaeon]
MEIKKLSEQELFKRAEQHIFSTGLNDIASRLCKTNMVYGLSKFHLAQENFGLEPSATFISTPDETVTRNIGRWENGLGYGGKISWGEGSEKFIFLDVKPNACGMLLGGLDELPTPKDVLTKIEQLQSKSYYIDDVKIKW